jgi:hypothetical protein
MAKRVTSKPTRRRQGSSEIQHIANAGNGHLFHIPVYEAGTQQDVAHLVVQGTRTSQVNDQVWLGFEQGLSDGQSRLNFAYSGLAKKAFMTLQGYLSTLLVKRMRQ